MSRINAVIVMCFALLVGACELEALPEDQLEAEEWEAITTCQQYYDSINYMNCQKGSDGKPKKCDGSCTCDKRCDCCLKAPPSGQTWCKQPKVGDTLYRVVHTKCDTTTKKCPAAPAASGGWYTDTSPTCDNYPDLCTWEGNDTDKHDCVNVYKITVAKGSDGKLNCKSPCDGPANASSPGECGGKTCKNLNTFLCGPGTLVETKPCKDCES